jgi:hypothetical protein
MAQFEIAGDKGRVGVEKLAHSEFAKIGSCQEAL